ncbi:MAG TPA: sugar phosphate isomerase/epimerase [Terriglobia bacterium]|nr:sugar phosphate isomerase/epimerase [Terriglobia bacterium]
MSSNMYSRRTFLRATVAGAAAFGALRNWPAIGNANPLGLPIGLQLYTVREQLQKDFDGTLRQVAAAGYQEVEMAGFYDRSAAEVRKSLDAAGLKCPSAHYPLVELMNGLDAKINYAKQLGLQYMICAFPWVADPSRFKAAGSNPMAVAMALANGLTLDDWKWNAEQFNKIGEQTQKAGIQFGYHNHDLEFKKFGGVMGYDEILRQTDPKLVTLELDCGWMAVAGHDPAAYLRKYRTRYSMLHVKDELDLSKPTTSLLGASATELGRGKIDYKPIFQAAKVAHIKHYFVEQEAFPDAPVFEAIKIDCDYLRKLSV